MKNTLVENDILTTHRCRAEIKIEAHLINGAQWVIRDAGKLYALPEHISKYCTVCGAEMLKDSGM